MIKNNYDKSSKGVNIETICYYDNLQARTDFDAEIIRLGRVSNYRLSSNLFGALSCSNVTRIGDFCTLKKGIKKADLIALADELPDFYNGESYTVKELKSEIMDASPEMILNAYWRADNGLKIKKDFELYETRGYSQGDCADVLIKSTDNKEYINHFFWDSPIYCRVEINGKEFFYDMIDNVDCYDWEKEKMIDYVVNAVNVDDDKKQYIKQTLSDLLPDYPNYN